jgi:hypothetical protein
MCEAISNTPLLHRHRKHITMWVCELGGAGEAFFTFLEKRKNEEKGRRELKELANLQRLTRLPRKPSWLLGFKRRELAVKRFDPRPPPCAKYQKSIFIP